MRQHRAAPYGQLGLAAAWILLAAGAQAAERQLDLSPESTRVTFTLPATGHDVEGAFRLSKGWVRFDPATGTASGEIVVDATAGETGNKSRDKTMRQDVLEVTRFPEIKLRIERLEGEVPTSGVGEFKLHGKVDLHGAEHPLTLAVKAAISGTHATADATFPVPFLDWGMHDPSVMFLKVEPVVTVSVHAEGELHDAAVAAGGGR